MGIRKVMVSDITDSTAKVTWETDLDATTELELWEKDQNGNYDPIDIGSVTGQGNTGVTMNHIFNLINLSADTTYQVKAKSYDEVMCDYMVSDDPSNPQEFTTLSAQQPVINSITVTAAKQRIAVGESMDIIAKCLDLSGAPVKGISVEFSAAGALSWLFFWLPPIGSLNPLIAQTDTNGEAKTVFTAARKGIAIIKAKAGNIENKVLVVIG